MPDIVAWFLAQPFTTQIIAAVLTFLLGKWGIPLVVKEPAALPVLGRIFKNKDDVQTAFEALRTLDEIHSRKGVAPEERRRLMVEGVNRIVTAVVGAKKPAVPNEQQ